MIAKSALSSALLLTAALGVASAQAADPLITISTGKMPAVCIRFAQKVLSKVFAVRVAVEFMIAPSRLCLSPGP